MRGPCLCGDTYCPSCGPLLGNCHCPICGVWTADGGCANPEECERLSREADDAYAEQLREDARLAEEWKNDPENRK